MNKVTISRRARLSSGFGLTVFLVVFLSLLFEVEAVQSKPQAEFARETTGPGGRLPTWKTDEVAKAIVARGYTTFIFFKDAVKYGYYPGRTSYKKVEPAAVHFNARQLALDRSLQMPQAFSLAKFRGKTWATDIKADTVALGFITLLGMSESAAYKAVMAPAQERKLASTLELEVVVDPREEEYLKRKVTRTLSRALSRFNLLTERGPLRFYSGPLPTFLESDVTQAILLEMLDPDSSESQILSDLAKYHQAFSKGRLSKAYLKWFIKMHYGEALKKIHQRARLAQLAHAEIVHKYGEDFQLVAAEGDLFLRPKGAKKLAGETVLSKGLLMSRGMVESVSISSGISYKKLRYLFALYTYSVWADRQ